MMKVSSMNKLNLWVNNLVRLLMHLEQFTANKTPHLYEEVMSMEVEGFDDDLLCSVFDYLVGRESKAKAFLAKSTKHRKIWLQKFSQG
ncbi:hypothetical protein Goari_006268 [Gossypium aridum]|uniref:Uncharacterized protein n=1 Tax=Gossypium aridum TaxID=34290 RepID=A0A7J8XMQ2_GOSAI|nr:hypothetical protein [Gossypium aridum]